MKSQDEIKQIIQDKIDDIKCDNSIPRMSDEYYTKNDAKINVLEEILRVINDDEEYF